MEGGRGLHAETTQSSRLVISGLISLILIVLATLNRQFHGRFVPIHFLEASSQNRGSLCHGYSLVIV